MGKGRDEIDLLLEAWARRRREVLGIKHPLTASEYLGSPRCTLGARRDLHHGARSNRLEQHWPEFPYTGTLFLVNLAVKRMKPTMSEIVDWHWTLEVPRDRRLRADLMGISPTQYWSRVGRAREFVAGVLVGLENVRTQTEARTGISDTFADCP